MGVVELEYHKLVVPGETNAEKRETDEFKTAFFIGMMYIHGTLNNGCVDITRNLGKFTIDAIKTFNRSCNFVRTQMIKGGMRLYPGKNNGVQLQLANSMCFENTYKMTIKNVLNCLYAPDFMHYVSDMFGKESEDRKTYVICLAPWANPADWQEFPKWLKIWNVKAEVQDNQLVCNANDMKELFVNGIHSGMLYESDGVLLHNKLVFNKDIPNHQGPQITREYKRSIVRSLIYMHGVIKNNYVDLTRHILPTDIERAMSFFRQNDGIHANIIKGGIRLSTGVVKNALKNAVKALMCGEAGKLSLRHTFGFIYAPNFMTAIIEHFECPSDNDTEIAIDMSWGNLDDLKYYPHWLRQYNVRSRIEGNKLLCNKGDIKELKKQCVWLHDAVKEIKEAARKSPKEDDTGGREYQRLRFKKDSSGKNRQTRNQKRSLIAALIYLCGQVRDGHVDIELQNPKEADYIMASFRDNDWVNCQKYSDTGIRIRPGRVRTALPSLLKKMQFGRNKQISLKRVFSYIHAPLFMRHLIRDHGCTDEANNRVVIDLSWAFTPDLPDYVRWLKTWDVRAEAEDTRLICNMKDISELEKDVDYVKEAEKFTQWSRKYAGC